MVGNPTNYSTFAKRVLMAKTITKVQQLEKSLDRLYLAGQITESEFRRLDAVIMNQYVKLEESEND